MRKAALDLIGPVDLGLVIGAIVRAACDLVLNRRDDRRMGMPEQQRAMSLPVVDQAVAVDIPFVRALSALDCQRKWLHPAAVMGDAAGEVSLCALVKLAGALMACAVLGLDRHHVVN